MKKLPSGAEVTRNALIDAALRLFGERGYDAVSTREIADQAAANIGSIAYHFGGKPGLRLACARHVMERIGGLVMPLVSQPLPPLVPQQAETMMEQGLENFGRFLVVSPQASIYAAFIIREVMQPGDVIDLMYDAMIGPVHRRFCQLFGLATGLEAESEEVRLAVFSLLGQVLYFRIARPLVLKRMEWSGMGAPEADRLVAILRKNLKALIVAYRKDQS
jgi:TetR/AcrR family transcriptional regulator, regulator of cefoperazone and chloramphenicol sensitivity